MRPSRLEQEILERLRDIEERLLVLESMPRPIVFAIGKMFPEPQPSDMQMPSELEH